MSLRFIHTADIHLGSPFKGLKRVPSSIKHKVVESTFAAFRAMVQWALDHEVDFMVIAGDIFDQSHRSIQAQLQFKQEMERLHRADIKCYIVHGNHDPLDGDFIKLELPDNVVVFSADKVERERFVQDGVEKAHIYGISYDTAKVTRNLALDFQREDEDVFSLGLLHTNCDAHQEHASYAPCSIQDLLQAGLDYWALGHVHQRRILHQAPHIVYAGNLQGRHIREQGEKGFYVVDVEGKRVVDLTFQPIHSILWLEREVDLTDLETVDELILKIEELKAELSEQYHGQTVILRVKGVGSTQLAYSLVQEEFTASLLDHVQQEQAVRHSAVEHIWIESFTFCGSPAYQRAELQQTEGMFQDIITLVDDMLSHPDRTEKAWLEMNQDLLGHYRVKQVLEPFSMEEKQEIIRQAEALLLGEWFGEGKR